MAMEIVDLPSYKIVIFHCFLFFSIFPCLPESMECTHLYVAPRAVDRAVPPTLADPWPLKERRALLPMGKMGV